MSVGARLTAIFDSSITTRAARLYCTAPPAALRGPSRLPLIWRPLMTLMALWQR